MPVPNLQISTRERNILLLAALVAVLFVGSYVIPAIGNVYQERQANIDRVLLDVAREARLIEDTPSWAARRMAVETRQEELQSKIFSGATGPLIEATIQRDLTQYARQASINVNSTRLAERLQTEGWLMVSQEMSFRTDSAVNTVNFLRALENSTPRLYVKDFSLDRSRQQYTGSITVVGFARSDGLSVSSRSGR